MSESAWIVLELRVLPGGQAAVAPAWDALVAALSVPPHRVLQSALSPEQALVYATTPDRAGFLQTSRAHTPAGGIRSFAALVWDADPRASGARPQRVRLAGAPAGWTPYDPALSAELADDPRDAIDPPAPDFAALSAQLAASVRRLDLALQASRAPFGPRHTRELVESVAIGVRAVRRVTPSELTGLVDEAEAALVRLHAELR